MTQQPARYKLRTPGEFYEQSFGLRVREAADSRCGPEPVQRHVALAGLFAAAKEMKRIIQTCRVLARD